MRPIDLHNPIASSIHWFAPHYPSAGGVEAFVDTLDQDDTGVAALPAAWDGAIDPDGS